VLNLIKGIVPFSYPFQEVIRIQSTINATHELLKFTFFFPDKSKNALYISVCEENEIGAPQFMSESPSQVSGERKRKILHVYIEKKVGIYLC
jgi:hypothetical protein